MVAHMIQYLAVLVPTEENNWRAHFPEFPGCQAEGPTVEIALETSTIVAEKQIGWHRQQRIALPTPRSYDEIRRLTKWAAERGISWSEAIVCVVPITPK
jgi:predicted RNase H-like HicB family nuclease